VVQRRRATWRRSSGRPPAVAIRELSDEDVEVIARRVATLISDGEPRAASLIDATEVARRFGLSRDWVYDHSHELGAITVGAGSRPRLRFDPARVAAVLQAPQPPTADSERHRHRNKASREEQASSHPNRLPMHVRGRHLALFGAPASLSGCRYA
jgi:hypothetical protein